MWRCQARLRALRCAELTRLAGPSVDEELLEAARTSHFAAQERELVTAKIIDVQAAGDDRAWIAPVTIGGRGARWDHLGGRHRPGTGLLVGTDAGRARADGPIEEAHPSNVGCLPRGRNSSWSPGARQVTSQLERAGDRSGLVSISPAHLTVITHVDLVRPRRGMHAARADDRAGCRQFLKRRRAEEVPVMTEGRVLAVLRRVRSTTRASTQFWCGGSRRIGTRRCCRSHGSPCQFTTTWTRRRYLITRNHGDRCFGRRRRPQVP